MPVEPYASSLARELTGTAVDEEPRLRSGPSATQVLLQRMLERGHVPDMPRIHRRSTTVSCLDCGYRGSIEAKRNGAPLRNAPNGPALFFHCPNGTTLLRQEPASPTPETLARNEPFPEEDAS